MEEKSPNEMTADELLSKIKKMYKDELYLEIVKQLDDLTLQEYNIADLYYIRGKCYDKRLQRKKAIFDINKAIEIEEKYYFYFSRGLLLRKEGELDKAIDDYDKTISLKKNHSLAYFSKGNIRLEQKEYKLAVQDYSKSIEYDAKHIGSYNNRGIAQEGLGEYVNAFNDFSLAKELQPNDPIVNINFTSIQIFSSIFENIGIIGEIRKNIQIQCANAKDIIDKIRAYATKEINTIIPNQKIAHYTKVSVADIFATNKKSDDKLRYYNAVFMNDPEEGIVVLEDMSKEVKNSFRRASEQEEDNIYIGSFLPADRHEDELVMWRTYGKDENGIDGAGCSLIIHTSFFDEYKDGAINSHAFATYSTKKGDKAVQCLYKVLYFNKKYKERNLPMVVGDEDGKIAGLISQFNEKMLELLKYSNERDKDDKINSVIDKVIYHLLSEIRFFFKSADYSFENEIRVIQFVPKDSESIEIDYSSKPKKVYVESNNTIQPHLEKIILGPKVPNPKQWLYLDIALRQNNPTRSKPVEVSISECKYQ